MGLEGERGGKSDPVRFEMEELPKKNNLDHVKDD